MKLQKNYTKITGDNVSGALYENDRKTNDRQPDYTGPIKVNGTELRVAAWKKQIKNGDSAGQDFLSLALSEKQQKTS